jgi:hypothetical protein
MFRLSAVAATQGKVKHISMDTLDSPKYSKGMATKNGRPQQ